MANNKDSEHLKPTQKNRRVQLLKKKGKQAAYRNLLIGLLGLVLLIAVSLGIYTIRAIAVTPEWDPQLLGQQKQSSVVYDKEGKPFAQLHASENRLLVEYDDIPKLIIDTYVAVEDKRFNDHFGVDPIRILKAAFNNLTEGNLNEGGSTITVQLAKNAFIENPTAKKLDRKIQEAILALQIERAYTKEEIITFYLNRIFLGESSFGIRTAAQTYFGKELKDLTPADVALLAGLPQAPSGYDPYINPDRAKNRRNLVLGIMKNDGIITEAQYNQYKEEPFTFVEQVKANQAEVKLPDVSVRNKIHPYFVDYVIAELQDKYELTPEQIYNGGLHIYTTVDTKIQEAAEKAFAKAENFPKSVDKIPVQGAITVLETGTGAISAMVGGREYTPMGLNRAWQASRQPGSTAKPLVVYGPALEKGGYYPGTVFDDMPVEYADGSGKAWAPENYDTETKGWRGLITMREAVEDSVNIYAVKLLDAIGVNYGWEFGKEKLNLPLKESDKVLSLGLGTFQVSTLQMASAYSTFGNNGVKTEPYSVLKVENAKGETVIEQKPFEKRVMKETTAYLMNDLLHSVVTSGTGTRAGIGSWYIAGKTGTTSLDPTKYGTRSGNPDAWFAGYSPLYSAVVWMGYDKDEDLKHYLYKVYGSSYPTTIWKEVMTVAHEGKPVQSTINRPKDITTVKFDRKSGLLPSSLTPEAFLSEEVCAVNSVPTSVSGVWIEAKVDVEKPDQLVSADYPGAVSRVFLNITDRPADVTWPAEEVPYRYPLQEAMAPSASIEEERPPAGEGSIPLLSIGKVEYDAKTSFIRVPVLKTFDTKKYTLMLYIKRPGVSYLESFVPEDNRPSVITYRLNMNGNNTTPGSYTFWAALMDNNTFKVGPPSNAEKLDVLD